MSRTKKEDPTPVEGAPWPWMDKVQEMRQSCAVVLTLHPESVCSCALVRRGDTKALAYETGRSEDEVVGRCYDIWLEKAAPSE